MRRILGITSAVMTAVLLTACGTTTGGPGGGGGPGGDTVDATVTARIGTGANLGDQGPVDSFTLSPGQDQLYRLQLPSSSEPALYVYLDEDLDLYLYRGSGSLYATSSSDTYFATGMDGLGVVAPQAGLAPQVVNAQTCPGSCIIADNPGSGNVFVRVHNPTATTRSYTLWSVLRPFDDANEDAFGPSNPEIFETTATGAIETLGDEDYFETDDSGFLYLDVAQGSVLNVVAQITDPIGSNPTRTLRPGGRTQIAIGEEIRVYTEGTPRRAAVSGNSQYFLSIEQN